MEITFKEYIKNPMGGSVFTQTEMYKNLYTAKLDAILVREAGNISYYLYKDNTRYLAHIKVPSEVVPKFYYDVVIEFYPIKTENKESNTLDEYGVRFYSNDPMFVYTYAYSFLKNRIFIKDLVPKMSREAVEKAAKEKNPKNIVGYVKSIYFAFLIMKLRGLFNKAAYITSFDISRLLNNIEHADIKVKKRKIEGARISEESKKEKKTPTQRTQSSKSVKQTMMAKAVNNIKKTKIVNAINKKSKTIPKIK